MTCNFTSFSTVFKSHQELGTERLCAIKTLLYLKITDFTNSVGSDEVAHDEPPHLNLHCSPSSLHIMNNDRAWMKQFLNECVNLNSMAHQHVILR